MTILAAARSYTLQVATDGAQVRAAQALRHRVFAGDLGATIHTPEPGLDIDGFDAHCDHLVIQAGAEVVGTYRMLPPGRSPHLYSDGEFHIRPLAPLRGALVETGRSCVHPDHRSGAVINLMWAGIARYMHLHGHKWLVGCASVPLVDGGATVAGVWDLARRRHLAPPAWRVTPRRPWPADAVAPPRPRTLPATVADVTDALRGGSVVAVFPEGTTWCGRARGPFRPALFQAAVSAVVAVVPARLDFSLADGSTTTVAAFVGTDSLAASLWRVITARGLAVTLRAYPALHPEPGLSRRALATDTATTVTDPLRSRVGAAATIQRGRASEYSVTFLLLPRGGGRIGPFRGRCTGSARRPHLWEGRAHLASRDL
jgi:putative hemolysin